MHLHTTEQLFSVYNPTHLLLVLVFAQHNIYIHLKSLTTTLPAYFVFPVFLAVRTSIWCMTFTLCHQIAGFVDIKRHWGCWWGINNIYGWINMSVDKIHWLTTGLWAETLVCATNRCNNGVGVSIHSDVKATIINNNLVQATYQHQKNK